MINFWDIEKFKNNVAIITENERITYSELLKRTEKVESALIEQPHRLVIIKCENNLNSIINYLAVLRTNCPAILLDYNLNNEQIKTYIQKYQPHFILDKNIQKLQSDTQCSSELAILLSTSGSTGNPKLVRLSRKNIQVNAESIAKYLNIRKTDRAITTLPFHYSYGLSVINSHFLKGASILLSSESVISKKFWNLINENKVTSFAGVPYTFDMLKKLRFENLNLPHLRYITQAGGKLSEENGKYFTQICQRKNIDFFIMYGQTEASPRMSYFKTNDFPKKINSIGKAIPGGKICLYDNSNNIVNNPYKNGELVYYGQNVMMGYAENQQDLEKTDDLKGVLYTGDVAFFDEDGFFFIAGRKNRFTKIQGLRMNLDDLTQYFVSKSIDAVAVSNDLLICIISEVNIDTEIRKTFLKQFKLHHSIVKFIQVEEIPKNSTGKILFKNLENIFNEKK